ncbi:TetR family transcriptional regulator [Pseudonocardia sp. CNS-004]|nr:TetR family transcriptional regulator [Pseudonocardia sp. CNS-004]
MAAGTRDALIGAAAGLLDGGGVEAVTLREVGRLAGVSHNAPYKHFAGKEALLAAVAARELTHRTALLARTRARATSPDEALRTVMYDYVAWALEFPARFKLTFGAWKIESPELAAAAQEAQAGLVELVAEVQGSGMLPPGDPARLSSLLRALAHGAADLAAAGHLGAAGKSRASPADLVDDLIGYLRTAASASEAPGLTRPR